MTSYENELKQVLLTIITNSKDAFITSNQNNKHIIIDCEFVRNNFTIFISDNAGGIDETIIDRVFEPYFTTKNKSEGTGLGLYIAKQIIENSIHGELKVKNIKDGVTFMIVLKELDE